MRFFRGISMESEVIVVEVDGIRHEFARLVLPGSEGFTSCVWVDAGRGWRKVVYEDGGSDKVLRLRADSKLWNPCFLSSVARVMKL